MRRALTGAAAAALLLTGCGDDDGDAELPQAAPASTETAEPADNNAACRLAGDTIIKAEIPSPTSLEPTRIAQMLVWDDADYAARVLEVLPADGQVAEDIDAVRQAMIGIAEWPANSFSTWPQYRSVLTQATTDLQASCQDAGVVDILNQN